MKLRHLSLVGISFIFLACDSPKKENLKPIQLDLAQAKKIYQLPTGCFRVEYPNKLGQVLGSDRDLKSPKTLHPIFYGCFDWHSSVHGYWSMIRLLKQFPALDNNNELHKQLDAHITAANVAKEIAFFNDVNNLSFERTYGWAWLFQLHGELHSWEDPHAARWAKTLQPLVDLLIQRYTEYLPKLVYPIRAGQHDNSAFSLNLSLDYARLINNKEFEDLLVKHAIRLFGDDQSYNLAFEPSGYDFLSPGLEEALLLAKVYDMQHYEGWLKNFMPKLFEKDFKLEPTIVKDRTDGKLVHLDGLNFSRATCLYGIADALPALAHLRTTANKHLAYSLKNIQDDDYMGSHWLGTFALYSLIHQSTL